MNASTGRARLAIGLTTLALAALSGASSARACVVGSGTSASCTEAALDTCLPGGGSFDGSVTFDCGGTWTITITTTKTISADTTIDGGGVITISGGGTVQVFAVSSGVNFTVQKLTIANGKTAGNGGGIANEGTTTLTDCTLSGNVSTADQGGAVYNDGTVNLTNCTLYNNSAAFGGGLFDEVGSTATLANCTLNGNTVSNFGGGIYNSGTASLTNCTLYGNSATQGGGILNGGAGDLTLTNCTLSNNSANDFNGGGLDNVGATTLANTIIANSPTGGDCITSGTLTDAGHNLIYDNVYNCGLSNGTNGDIVGSDPALGPLANNSGPTQTMALMVDSPALDAADNAICLAAPVNNLDQRGFVRITVKGPVCDIGAYELGAVPPVSAPALSIPAALLLGLLLISAGFVLANRHRA